MHTPAIRIAVAACLLALYGCEEGDTLADQGIQNSWPAILQNVVERELPHVRWLEMDRRGPYAQAIRADGQVIALETSCESIVYDLKSGKQLHSWRLPTRVAQFSRDGKFLLTTRKGKFILWDAVHFEELHQFSGSPPSWEDTLYQSPPLVTLSDEDDLIAVSNNLRLFDKNQPSALLLFSHAGILRTSLLVPEDAVIRSAKFLPGQRLLLSYSNVIDDRYGVQFQLWDTATGALVRSFDRGEIAKVSNNAKLVATAFVDQGPFSSTRQVKPMSLEIFSAPSGDALTSIERPETIRDFVFNPNSTRILVPVQNQLLEWDVETGTETFVGQVWESPLASVAYSPDGKMRLATVEVPNGVDDDVDHFLHAWDVRTDESIELAEFTFDSYNGMERLFFFPEGDRFIDFAAEFAVRDLATGGTLQVAPTFRVPQQQVNYFQEGGLFLVDHLLTDAASGRQRYWSLPGYHHSSFDTQRVLSEGAGVYLSDIESGQMYWKLPFKAFWETWDAGIAAEGSRIVVAARYGDQQEAYKMILIEPSRPDTPVIVPGFASAVCVSPDGSHFIAASYAGIDERDAVSGEHIRTLWIPPGRVAFAKYSPDGMRLLVGGAVGHTNQHEPVDSDDDGWAAVVDLKSSRVSLLEGHTAPVSTGDFSSEGHRCVTGSFDRTIRLWSSQDASQLHVFRGHRGGVASLAYCPLGDRLLSAGPDGAALWDIAGVVDIDTRLSPLSDAFDRVESINAWNGKSGQNSIPLFSESAKPVDPTAQNVDWSLVEIGETSQLSGLSGDWLSWAKDIKRVRPNPYVGPVGALDDYLDASLDGSHRLYSSTAKNRVMVTDSTDRVLSQFEVRLSHREAALSANGSELAIVRMLKPQTEPRGMGVYQLTVYDTKTGDAKRTMDDIASWYVHSVKIDPQGETILLQIDNSSLELRDFQTGSQLAQLRESPAGPGLVSAYTLDGSYIATSKFPETDVRLRDPKTLEVVKTLGGQLPIRWFRFTPDGTHILVGQEYSDERLLLAKYEIETGRRLWSRAGPASADGVFSPDGNYLLMKSDWYTWSLWDMRVGELRSVIIGESQMPNNTPVFSGDSKSLYLGAIDGTLLWSHDED